MKLENKLELKQAAKNPQFRTRYGEFLEVAVATGDPNDPKHMRTKQSFKDECDINNIMKKFNKTGQLPEMIKQNPSYGDFSEPLDFQESQNVVIKAIEQFQALPSKTRERFQNDPETFLRYMHSNPPEEEVRAMGLLKEKPPAPVKQEIHLSKESIDAIKSGKVNKPGKVQSGAPKDGE